MPEILHCPHIDRWPEAVLALEHNEAAAAVLDICDPDTAAGAIVTAQNAPYLHLRRLPKILVQAVNRARYQLFEAEQLDEATEPLAYTQGATGMHIDMYTASDRLTTLFTARGNVEATFVPCSPWPRKATSLPFASQLRSAAEIGLPEGLHIADAEFLPQEVAKTIGATVIIHAGQLVAFSGSGDRLQGRWPVAHQFISQGDTVAERNDRCSVLL